MTKISSQLSEFIGSLPEAEQTQSGAPALLVGFNSSARAKSALNSALAIGHETGRAVRVLSILDADASKDEALETLSQIKETVSLHTTVPDAVYAEVQKMSAHFDDEEYGRARSFIEASVSFNASLIVLGIHEGDKPLSGTMTEKLLKEAICPVLISTGQENKNYRQAMIAVEFAPFMEQALETLEWLAPESEVHLVHALEDAKLKLPGTSGKKKDGDSVNAEIASLIATHRNKPGSSASGASIDKYTTCVERAKPVELLEQKVTEIEPDLFVTGTRARTGLSKFVLGSVATRFIDKPPCDLLVIREK
ncbi:MAG: universal stress protein [Aquisalinus sp.]|nr:universal stress protein [Aquisalinus sp.]